MTTKAELQKKLDLMMQSVILTKKLRNMRIEKELQNTEFELAKENYFKPVIGKIDNVENRMVTFNTGIEHKINSGNAALNDIHNLQIVTGQYLRERDQNLNETLNQHQQDLISQQRLAELEGLPNSTIHAINSNEIRIGPVALKYLKGLKNQAYGITYNIEKEKYFIGNDERFEVNFEYNDLIIRDVMDEEKEDLVTMTPGLWQLLTRDQIDVEHEDELLYQQFSKEYGLLFKSNGQPRQSKSKKWTQILSKSSWLQPKDVILNKSKFRTTSDSSNDKTSSSSTAIPTATNIPSARVIAKNLKRRQTIASPIFINDNIPKRQRDDLHAQNIEGETFGTPNATLNSSRMDISFGSGFKRKNSLVQPLLPPVFRQKGVKPSSRQTNNIYLPDDDNFLVERYKTYLSALFLGHNINYNEANQIAHRLIQRKILNKKQYTQFINLLNKHVYNK